MSRLSVVLSALALVVAAVALAVPYAGRPAPALDRAAVADAVREVVTADPSLVPSPARDPAPQAEAAPMTPDADTIGPAVRQYLLANPEVLEEVIAALEAKRDQAQASAQKNAVAENREALSTPDFSTAVGNPEGDVTLVEFFDYNCGYCKRMLPHILELIDNDDSLRVVFKEWPVLGEDSQAAARVALAVRQVAPDKYFEFHRTLLAHRGRVGQGEAIGVAEELGIDTAALESQMGDEQITAALRENFRLGDALGLQGTPSYVVGDKVFMGAVPKDALESQIAEARGGACTNC